MAFKKQLVTSCKQAIWGEILGGNAPNYALFQSENGYGNNSMVSQRCKHYDAIFPAETSKWTKWGELLKQKKPQKPYNKLFAVSVSDSEAIQYC